MLTEFLDDSFLPIPAPKNACEDRKIPLISFNLKSSASILFKLTFKFMINSTYREL